MENTEFMSDTDEGVYNSFDTSNSVSSTNTWPERIIKTIIFLHSGYVFLSKFGVDLTFARNID